MAGRRPFSEHEVCMFVIRCSFPCIFRFRSKIHAKIIRRHLFLNEMAHRCHLPSPFAVAMSCRFWILSSNFVFVARNRAPSHLPCHLFILLFFFCLCLCMCICVPRLVHLNYSYSLHKFKFTFYEIARAHLCRVQKKSNDSTMKHRWKKKNRNCLGTSLIVASHRSTVVCTGLPVCIPIYDCMMYIYIGRGT